MIIRAFKKNKAEWGKGRDQQLERRQLQYYLYHLKVLCKGIVFEQRPEGVGSHAEILRVF